MSWLPRLLSQTGPDEQDLSVRKAGLESRRTWKSGMNLGRSQGHGRWASGQGVGPPLELAPLSPLWPRNSPEFFSSSWVISFSLASLAPVPGDPSRAQVGMSQALPMTCTELNVIPRSPPLSWLLVDSSVHHTPSMLTLPLLVYPFHFPGLTVTLRLFSIVTAQPPIHLRLE